LKTKSFSVEKVFAENGPFPNSLNISELKIAGFCGNLLENEQKNAINRIYDFGGGETLTDLTPVRPSAAEGRRPSGEGRRMFGAGRRKRGESLGQRRENSYICIENIFSVQQP